MPDTEPPAWRSKTPTFSFRMPKKDREDFVQRCHDQGKTATDVLLELIANWMRRTKP